MNFPSFLNFRFKTQLRPGFTIIETIIVISMIGILTAIGTVTFQSAQKSGRDSARKAELKRIQIALEKYYAVNRTYPSTGGSAQWWGFTYGSGAGPNYIPGLAPTYINQLPVDPHNNQPNATLGGGCVATPSWVGYLYASDGRNYKLLAHCTAEAPNAYGNTRDPLYDPVRSGWAWQVSSDSSVAVSW